MRSLVLIFMFLSGLLIFGGCSKLDDSTQMNIDLNPSPADFSIPITASLDAGILLTSIPVNLDLDAMIKLQNKRFSKANVKSIRLTSVVLTLTSEDKEVNLSSVENVRMTIDGGGKTTELLASLNAPDSQVKTLNIPVTSTVNDLTSFISDGMVTYIFKGKLRKPTTQNLVGKAALTYRVELAL